MKPMDRKGKLSTALVSSVLITVVVLIIVFQAIADTGSTMGNAAANMTATNLSGLEGVSPPNVYPLTGFFKKKGVILLAFMAGVAITVISAVIHFKK